MIFSVDYELKNDIQDLLIRNTPSLCRLRKVSVCAVLISLLCAALYGVLHFLVPDFNTVLVNGVLEKDHIGAWGKIILTMVFGIITWYCLNLWIVNRTNKDLSERIDEWLGVENNELCYHFRLRYTGPSQEYIFRLPTDKDSIEYDPQLKRFVFKNCVLCRSPFDDAKSVNLNETVDLTLYDYFPGLYDYLTFRQGRY